MAAPFLVAAGAAAKGLFAKGGAAKASAAGGGAGLSKLKSIADTSTKIAEKTEFSRKTLSAISKKTGKIVSTLAKSSPALQQQMVLFNRSMQLFLRPMGDTVARWMAPLARGFLRFANWFYDIWPSWLGGQGGTDDRDVIKEDLEGLKEARERALEEGDFQAVKVLDAEIDKVNKQLYDLDKALLDGQPNVKSLIESFPGVTTGLGLLDQTFGESVRTINAAIKLLNIEDEMEDEEKQRRDFITTLRRGDLTIGGILSKLGIEQEDQTKNLATTNIITSWRNREASTQVDEQKKINKELRDERSVLQGWGSFLFKHIFWGQGEGLSGWGDKIYDFIKDTAGRLIPPSARGSGSSRSSGSSGGSSVGPITSLPPASVLFPNLSLIASLAKGGNIDRTGMYQLHAGEKVLTAGETSRSEGKSIVINNTYNIKTSVNTDSDIRNLAKKISAYNDRELKRRISYV